MTPVRRKKLMDVINKRQPDLAIVLENVFDPHNIAAVMRSCDAVGVQEVFVLNTKIPPHKKWGFKSSSSADKWLTIHQFDNTQECLQMLRKNFSTILTTYLDTGSVSLYDINFTGEPVALVFGNEQNGVSEEIRKLADGNFKIPQYGIIRSLNISVACAVTLYEASRQKQIAGYYNRQYTDDVIKQKLRKDWEVD